jgi:anti-sigma B factor antagonist
MQIVRFSRPPSPSCPPGPRCRLVVGGATLDRVVAHRLYGGVRAALDAGAREIVIDMTGVESIDPLGLSALSAIRRKVPVSVRVVLAGMKGRAGTVARVTHLHELFPIFVSVDAATGALRALGAHRDQD